MAGGTDLVTITYSISGKRSNGESFVSETTQTITKAKAGVDGAGANLVQLAADAFTIVYDANGSNPSPSSIKLMATSSNFDNGYFKFTGGGAAFTDETSYTDGAGANNDSATFTSPSSYSSTPYTFRVGVADGDQTELVSDFITIASLKPGADASPQYFITPIAGGTQLKNSGGSIELQVQKSATTGLTDVTSGTDARIYDGATLLAAQTGVTDGGNGVAYNPVITSAFITGTKTLLLKDNGGNVLDSITLLDVTDGLGGGSFISPNLKTTRDPSTNTYTPTFLSLTASFYDTSGTEYTKAVRVTPNYASGTDYMYYDNDAGAHTDSEIVLSIDDGDGTVFSGTGIGNKLATKDVVVTATFTDPSTSQTSTMVETVYIISDGADGLDAITVISTNQAHTLPADSAGTVSSYAGSGTTISVYEGTTQLDYDGTGTANGKWTVSVTPVNITAGSITDVGSTAVVGDHSSMTATQASASYAISGKRTNGDSFTASTIQTFTKSVAGTNGTNGQTGASVNIVFIRNATQPSTPAPSSGVPSGWSDSPPSGTDLLWASQGTKGVGDTNFTWGTPYQVEGTAVAEVTIYRKNSNAGNTGGSYNFTTSTLTPPTNWSSNVPALSANLDVVYASNAVFSGAPTDTAATTAGWSTPVIYAQRTDGTSGTSGADGTNGAAGTPSGIVYAGAWVSDGTFAEPNVYLAEEELKYIVKYSSTYYVCATTHEYTGTWSSSNGYSAGDVVFDSVDSTYYIANASTSPGASAPNTDPGEWDAIGASIAPGSWGTGWTAFGAQFTSVATDILFAEDVYANRTINIGAKGGSPTIALNADSPNYDNPFISIGQGGTQGFAQNGIFMGYKAGSPVLSFVTSSAGVQSYFIYESGSITLSDANFTGTGSIIEGSEIRVGETSPGSNQYNFRVDTDGNLFANSGSFRGTIDATGGNIGEWNLTTDYLASAGGNITLDATEESIIVNDTGGNVRFNANTETSLPSLGSAVSTQTKTISTTGVTATRTFTVPGVTSSTVYRSGASEFTAAVTGKHRLSYTYNNGNSSYVTATGSSTSANVSIQMLLTNNATGGSPTTIASSTTISKYAAGYDVLGELSVSGDTKILLSDGSIKLAKDITTSDFIYAWDEINNKYSEASITEVLTRKVKKFFRVIVGDKVVDVSESHGFWIDGGWLIKVQDIIPGETEIYIKDGDDKKWQVVDSVEEIFEEIDVYTFRVPEFANYISNDVISHNPVGYTPMTDTEYIPNTTFTATGNLTNGSTYYVHMKISYSLSVYTSDPGHEAEVAVYLNSGPATLVPLTAGTVINGGGFQAVVSSTAYLRVVSDDAKQYGSSIGYYTDLRGGIAVDAVYGAGGFSPATGIGGAWNVAGHPYLIKGAAIITYTDSDTGTHGLGTVRLSAGNFSSMSGTAEGVYTVNWTSVTANGAYTSGKYGTVIATARREPGGGGIGETAILGVTTSTSNAGTGNGQTTIYVGKPNSSILNNLQNLQFIILQ
jgi:hypothetical protein